MGKDICVLEIIANDAALIAAFYRGLNDKVKDIVCLEERLHTLKKYIRALIIDNRISLREEERPRFTALRAIDKAEEKVLSFYLVILLPYPRRANLVRGIVLCRLIYYFNLTRSKSLFILMFELLWRRGVPTPLPYPRLRRCNDTRFLPNNRRSFLYELKKRT
ncbi:hypothetical protein G7Y89_g7322 [Cudoniella acicularis]|uniref:Uncharacterized protein n=1 Tax=Cudoniella acicularis TaxID=354080 RepID=A0A8H4RKC3_9HELO|nr:hypothetical protein G7Y89_g7322 [Cudoniella acicularis]